MARRRSRPRSGIKIRRPGAFHRWAGKSPGQPITSSDISRGLRSGNPNVRRMANFARNSRKWNRGGGRRRRSTSSSLSTSRKRSYRAKGRTHRVRGHSRVTVTGRRVKVRPHRRRHSRR